MGKMKEKAINDRNEDIGNFENKYANWIFEECDSPIEEIEYLFSLIPLGKQQEIYESLKDELKN